MSANEVITLRMKLGMKQEEISDAFGLHNYNTVSRWETGFRKPNEAIRRVFCLLNDLPEKQAREMIHRLGQYKKKR